METSKIPNLQRKELNKSIMAETTPFLHSSKKLMLSLSHSKDYEMLYFWQRRSMPQTGNTLNTDDPDQDCWCSNARTRCTEWDFSLPRSHEGSKGQNSPSTNIQQHLNQKTLWEVKENQQPAYKGNLIWSNISIFCGSVISLEEKKKICPSICLTWHIFL